MKRYLLPIAVLALLFLGACGIQTAAEEAPPGTSIYFLDISPEAKGGDALKAVSRDLGMAPTAPAAQRAEAAIRALLKSSPEEQLQTPLPGVELLGVTVMDQCAHVDFSSAFGLLDGVELTLADYALTLTLTELDGISSVSVTVQGQPVGQQPKPIFYGRDVRLFVNEDTVKAVNITLYFPNANNILVGEYRTLHLYEGQTVAENLIAALFEGPVDQDLQRIIPAELSFSSVRMDNSICTLNLVGESLSSLPEDPAAQELILRSIGKSLYSIKTIQGIRILVDGEAVPLFGSVPVDPIAARPQE